MYMYICMYVYTLPRINITLMIPICVYISKIHVVLSKHVLIKLFYVILCVINRLLTVRKISCVFPILEKPKIDTVSCYKESVFDILVTTSFLL